MAEVLLFHPALGQTPGFFRFAEQLRSAGHTVHTPDLYEGKTFTALDEGVAHAEQVGFGTIITRGAAAAADLLAGLVYAGFSLGVLPAQMLAQTRPGARGALLFHSCLPPSEFEAPWPDGVPLQIHMMEGDEWVLPPNEDLAVARQLAEEVESAELFVYPGNGHLFADDSVDDYDEDAAVLLQERVLAFLQPLG
jgi:dienelactone hydrolase